MTPEEKALELVRKYYTFGINKEGQTLSWYECKQCALIAVDEILSNPLFFSDWGTVHFWQEVKKEIGKL